ncbi:TatD family hydrolase [Phaeocystidibacter luteus]|uniref:TatD family deoxyribonuclease n=1 Tax=Phaeocystidibacter luteus TaxID=911197 RepID=A0A6N6RDD5_9FLAO|nr:TatD family hydrolase [Phaeocystidibacter luteus]KAB2807030.1 TatD family deoxyribonuclease [Phaeocystidibacter luteus]
MQYIDTHTHLFHKQFDEDRAEMMERARVAGVERVLLPNIDVDTIDRMMKMVEDYPGRAFPMMGIHPTHVGEDRRAQLDTVRSWFEKSADRFVAVGEIGIDLYWEKDKLDWQVEAFEEQIDIALEFDKPIVIHARDSFDEIFESLERKQNGNLKGVLHCFTGNIEQANRCLDLGMHLGIGGVATFKNGGLDKVLPHVSKDVIILETDSPYLAPVPYRGKRNESSYVPIVAQRVAELMGMTVKEVAEQTTLNAEKLFRLP